MKPFYTKLAVVMLIFTMLFSQMACTNAQIQKNVQLVLAELPVFISLLNAIIPVINAFTANNPNSDLAVNLQKFQGDAQNAVTEITRLGNAYLGGDKTALQSLQNVVDTLVTETDGLMMNVLQIKDTNTQNIFKASVIGLDTVMHIIDAYILQTQTQAQIRARSANRTVKLQQLKSSLDWNLIEKTMGKTEAQLYNQAVGYGF